MIEFLHTPAGRVNVTGSASLEERTSTERQSPNDELEFTEFFRAGLRQKNKPQPKAAEILNNMYGNMEENRSSSFAATTREAVDSADIANARTRESDAKPGNSGLTLSDLNNMAMDEASFGLQKRSALSETPANATAAQTIATGRPLEAGLLDAEPASEAQGLRLSDLNSWAINEASFSFRILDEQLKTQD